MRHRCVALLTAATLLHGCSCGGQAPPAPTAPVPAVLLSSRSMTLTERRWSWGDQQGSAWTVQLPRSAAFRVVASEEVRWLHELVPEPTSGTAVINGGFYEDGPMGLVVSDGVELAPLTDRGGSGILTYNGQQAEVVHRPNWTGGAQQALQSIDRLVVDGNSVVKHREGAPLAARSAVVLSEDALWLVIHAADASVTERTASGARISDPYDHGMPLWAFADWLVTELHAVDALNLDGGFSTNLTVVLGARTFQITGVDGTINAIAVPFD